MSLSKGESYHDQSLGDSASVSFEKRGVTVVTLQGVKGSKECYKGYYSPKKTNMEPEHHCFEKERHLPNLYFLGSMLVFGSV